MDSDSESDMFDTEESGDDSAGDGGEDGDDGEDGDNGEDGATADGLKGEEGRG